jgi:dethiobiotin synthetase
VRIVVVGTGTEVGKTHVTACLLASARLGARRLAAYKPVATGVETRCEDCVVHADALGAPYVAPTYAFRRPVSPHLAAREEGRPIDLGAIAEQAERMRADGAVVVVETAGGLFTPLAETLTNVDLVRRLSPAAVVLVAPDRIGVLHDVRACLLAAASAGVSIGALVLSAPAHLDDSTGTNATELSNVGLGPVAASFPRAAWAATPSLDAARAVWRSIDAWAEATGGATSRASSAGPPPRSR